MKKILCIILALTMLVTMVSVQTFTVYAADAVADPSVFLKQEKSDTCTLASSAMMLRRRAYLEGNSNWKSITEKSLGMVAWSATGLSWDFKYAGIHVVKGSFSKMTTEQKKNTLISLLSQHPEGVVIYMYGDGRKTHAVLATDYDASTGTIYCADPARNIANGRIPLTSAYLTGKNQSERIGNLKMYWYVKSGNCNLNAPAPTPTPAPPAHTHSYSYSYDSSHPHSEYKYCSCGDKIYTANRKNVSSCSSCHPLSSIRFSRSYKKTEGEVTFYRGYGENITSYTLTVYKNGSYYDTYDMYSTERTLRNMPSGKYSAMLTIKNSNTGQQKNIYCDDFEFKETYNIYYNANGGSGAPSTDEKIQDVDKTLSSKIPTRAHYVFKGWAKSKNATTPKYNAGDKYTSNANITLYAVWEPEVYTVSFDANGGKGELESVLVTYGNKIKLPNSVILDSKYLKGWSTKTNSATAEFKPGEEVYPEQNTVFYAVWGSSTWNNEVSSSLSGSGTENDPYKIATAADLAYLANTVNSATSAPEYKYYILTDNISINYEEWVPIGLFGNENQYFYGCFDGNGYRISNFYVTQVNEGYVGIFGYAKDSVFKNLNVSGIIENISSDKQIFAASVAGYAKNTTFENCETLYVNISGISASDSECSYIGGIAGKADGGKIYGCTSTESHINLKAGDFEAGLIVGYSSGDIENCNVKSTSSEGLFSTSTGVGDFKIGGICGNLSGNADKCSVNALLFSNAIKTTSASYAGGIAGNLSGRVNICSVILSEGDEKNIDDDKYKSSMHVSGSGSYSLGGIAGFQEGSASITDCKYDGQSISGITSSGSASVGGFSGSAEAKKVIFLSSGQTLNRADMPLREGFKATWYTDATMKTPYDFSQTVTSDLTLYAKWEKGEEEIDIWDGTSKEPSYNAETKTYTITNGEELAWISDVSNGVITSGTNFPSNVTFGGYTIELANDIYLNDISNCENWETTPPDNSWNPIGTFGGIMEGNNRRISGLYIKKTTDYTGLFSELESAIVKNITLCNGFISGTRYTGGIAGYAAESGIGQIYHCHNLITIIGTNYVGGIVGYTSGSSISIYYCSNKGNVTGNYYIGGISGFSGSIIYACYNIANITGTNFDVGGISGFSYNSILNCHSDGVITANYDCGGICGVTDSKISDCYFIGTFFGSFDTAAIVGHAYDSARLTDCYAPYSELYTGSANISSVLTVSKEQIKNLEYMDFSTQHWGVNPNINDGYPHIIDIEETYKTYSITTVVDNKDSSAISRSFANIDGILYSESAADANVGGAIGSVSGNSGASNAMNFMTIASRVSSKTSGSSYMANSGYLAGNNKNGLYSFANAYYGSGMDISAVNSGNSSNIYTNDEGTARSKVSLNSAFYTKTLGLNPYVSVANTESDYTAVWVLNDGQLPELYYNCLNDITVSKDIENGTVTLDKEKAVNGESVTVTATPNKGYVLNKIYVNGAEVIDENNQFTVSGQSEVYVTFSEEIPQYNVEIQANENASASVTNTDSTSAQLLSTATSFTANDGDEIRIDVGTDENYVLDTLLVNGEEIVSDSFVVTENSAVTMQITDISTDITAETYDAEDVGDYFAVLGGSVSGDDDEAVKYIRYWKADDPSSVFVTKAEEGSGEYTAEILPLEPETTYQYQMTQYGEVKSFTTLATPDDSMGSDADDDNTDTEIPEPAESVTNTTITKLSSGYLVSITASQSLANKKLVIAFYNGDECISGVKILNGTEDVTYTLAVGEIDATYVKVFALDIPSLVPIAGSEKIIIN